MLFRSIGPCLGRLRIYNLDNSGKVLVRILIYRGITVRILDYRGIIVRNLGTRYTLARKINSKTT